MSCGTKVADIYNQNKAIARKKKLVKVHCFTASEFKNVILYQIKAFS